MKCRWLECCYHLRRHRLHNQQSTWRRTKRARIAAWRDLRSDRVVPAWSQYILGLTSFFIVAIGRQGGEKINPDCRKAKEARLLARAGMAPEGLEYDHHSFEKEQST